MAAEKTAVQMEDGSTIEFGAKQKMIKTSKIDGKLVEIRLDFVNGKTLTYFTGNHDMLMKLAVHGAEQKLGDEIAGIVEIEDCYLAVESLINRLDKGEWSKERESNGMAGTSILIRALMEQSGKPVETVKAYLADKTHAQKLALRNNAKVKVIVERLEAEKAAKKPAGPAIDTDALLDELN